jgi:hypothetical protein
MRARLLAAISLIVLLLPSSVAAADEQPRLWYRIGDVFPAEIEAPLPKDLNGGRVHDPVLVWPYLEGFCQSPMDATDSGFATLLTPGSDSSPSAGNRSSWSRPVVATRPPGSSMRCLPSIR